MADGQMLTVGEKDELRQKADIIDQVDNLVSGWVQPGTTVPFIRNLQAENIKIPSGEITLGDNVPGSNFSGVRIAFPALIYNGEEWNIVGVNSDVLQVGIRASDGKFLAGGGDVVIDNGGIRIKNNQDAAFAFENASGGYNITLLSGLSNDVALQNANTDGSILLKQSITGQTLANSSPFIRLRDDTAIPGALRVDVNEATAQKGSHTTFGVDALIDLRTQGTDGTGSTMLRMRETANTPPSPGAGDAMHIYMKGDKLIIQFNDGGTVRYKYLDLTGTGVTWVHTTVAP